MKRTHFITETRSGVSVKLRERHRIGKLAVRSRDHLCKACVRRRGPDCGRRSVDTLLVASPRWHGMLLLVGYLATDAGVAHSCGYTVTENGTLDVKGRGLVRGVEDRGREEREVILLNG